MGLKKNGVQSIGKSRGGWTTKIHMVAADERTAVVFSLSSGKTHDVPEGEKLLKILKKWLGNIPMIMDKAYEGDSVRQLVLALEMTPFLPPKANRLAVCEYDKKMYKNINQIERLFRRLKGFRRVFSRFDQLGAVFRFSINFALIIDKLNSVNTPWFR